jgi:hypothetical protein
MEAGRVGGGGHHTDNAVKYFVLVTLEELKADLKWRARATQITRIFQNLLDPRRAKRSSINGCHLTRRSCISVWPKE